MRENKETAALERWTYKKEGDVKEYHFENFLCGKHEKIGEHSDTQSSAPPQTSAPMKKTKVPWCS